MTQGGNPSVLNPSDTPAAGKSTETDKIKNTLKDAMKQVKKKEIKPSGEKKKDTAPKYNPYGTGTANPSNMSGSTGP